LLRVGARPVDDVMELMRQNASQSTPEKQVATSTCGGRKRTSDAVAFYIGEGDDRTIRDVSVGQGDRVGGKRWGKGLRLTGSVERNDHDTGKRIRRRDFAETPPVQIDSGIAHEVLEFPFHFVDGRLRMLSIELKDEGDRASCEGSAG
jgi:hypothetical protein